MADEINIVNNDEKRNHKLLSIAENYNRTVANIIIDGFINASEANSAPEQNNQKHETTDKKVVGENPIVPEKTSSANPPQQKQKHKLMIKTLKILGVVFTSLLTIGSIVAGLLPEYVKINIFTFFKNIFLQLQ